MNRSALWNLWEAIQSGDTPAWPPGRALEYLVVRAFELSGAEVRYPYSVHVSVGGAASEELEQIDGMVFANGLWCLCEAKDTTDPQNIEPIAKLRNQLLRRPAGCIGLAFSVNGFTEPAKLATHFMGEHAILLWSGDDIDWGLRNGFADALHKKYRFAVESGLRDYSLLAEDVK